jgi:hypothetical protein
MPKINWKEYNERLVKRRVSIRISELVHTVSDLLFVITTTSTTEPSKDFAEIYLKLEYPRQTTQPSRFLKMDFTSPALNSEEIVIAVDSTGIKVHNRGEWMREKYRRRRGWIKIHFAVDVETKQIVAYEVTDEQMNDNKKFKDLVEKSEERERELREFSSIKRTIAMITSNSFRLGGLILPFQ